jgi:hypothetical protein
MSVMLLLKLVHVLIAFWFIGGLVGRTVVLRQAAAATDVRTVDTLVDLAGRFERWMIQPGSLVVLAAGVLTAWMQGRPLLGFIQGASGNWLLLTLVLYLSIVPLIIWVFVPRGRRFAQALGEARALGTVTLDLRDAFGDRVVAAAHAYEWLILVVIVALMITKPF